MNERLAATENGILSKKQQHILNIVVAIIGVVASVLALFSWGTYYVGNQAIDQPFLQCASYAFTDPFQVSDLGPNFRLPRSVILTLVVGRTNPDFILPVVSKGGLLSISIRSYSPPIDATWRYRLSYRFTFDVSNPLFGSLPLPTTNTTTFTLPTNGLVTVKWKFSIDDFTRQNLNANITLGFDDFSEHYSAYRGTAFEIARSAHDSRQLNDALLVYSFASISNSTLREQYAFQFYLSRARQTAYAILGGVTSMLSFATGNYGWCGQPQTGQDMWE
jgi:hypothetical protein